MLETTENIAALIDMAWQANQASVTPEERRVLTGAVEKRRQLFQQKKSNITMMMEEAGGSMRIADNPDDKVAAYNRLVAFATIDTARSLNLSREEAVGLLDNTLGQVAQEEIESLKAQLEDAKTSVEAKKRVIAEQSAAIEKLKLDLLEERDGAVTAQTLIAEQAAVIKKLQENPATTTAPAAAKPAAGLVTPAQLTLIEEYEAGLRNLSKRISDVGNAIGKVQQLDEDRKGLLALVAMATETLSRDGDNLMEGLKG